jgi:cytochrome c oxidase assembly protein subunit 15
MRGLEILLVLQVTLGILVIFSLRSPIVATLHVVIGALMLAGSVLLSLRAARLS